MNEHDHEVIAERVNFSMSSSQKGQDNPCSKASTDILSNTADDVYSVFSDATKTYLTYLLGIVITISTLTATIYFPLIVMLAAHFQVDIQLINLTITVYAICQAFSPMLFASMADSYGRRPVLLVLLSVYAAASLGLAINKSSYGVLIGMRALQSVGGSATPPIAYGIVADVANVAERGKMLGPMLSTCNAISAIGPVVGGAVALRTDGYTWVFISLLVVGVSCFLLVGLTVPETARNVVFNGSRQTTGIRIPWASYVGWRSSVWSPKTSHDTSEPQRKGWNWMIALQALRIIFIPDAALVLWMNASAYSIYYTFQVAIPVIFADNYRYNSLEIGLAFFPGLAGMTIGGIIAGKFIDWSYRKEMRKQELHLQKEEKEILSMGIFPIEKARYRSLFPFIVIEAALIIGYGWAVHHRVHPAVPITLQSFICGLATMLSHIASALLVDIFPDVPSTAYASGQVVRCALSAASAAAIEPLVDAIGRGWYFTLFSLFTGMSCGLCVMGSRSRGMLWRIKRSKSGNQSEGEKGT